MRAVMLGVLGCLAACNDGGKGGSENVDIGIMKSRIEILEGRVSRLESRQPADYAFLKPGDKNWTWISNGAYSLRVGISNVAESGSGSKVRLDIQNPLAISLQDCEIDLLWGETDTAGTPVESSKHKKFFDIPGGLPAGDYAFPEFVLDDVPPKKLGFVTIRSIECRRTK
ncbi:hypothetical protein [Sphingobium yanoikuyae]|jgi:hypothetical protein|uniref:hypothetical protein n=1 Tax=Sphingobium yanoikuyae TaxID=13690 RepID=UPI0035C7B949